MKNFFEKLRVEDWVVVWVSIPLLLLAALIPADLPSVPATLVGEVAWYNIGLLFAIVLVVLYVGCLLLRRPLKGLLPSLVVVFAVSLLAQVVAKIPAVSYYGFESVFFSVLFGLVIRNVWRVPAWMKPAIQGEFFIKIGVVCLGATILFSDVMKSVKKSSLAVFAFALLAAAAPFAALLVPPAAPTPPTDSVQADDLSPAATPQPLPTMPPSNAQNGTTVPNAALAAADITLYDADTGTNRVVSVRDFLIGAAACEMPPTWNDDTLLAQMVASHSYALALGAPMQVNSALCAGWTDTEVLKTRWGDDFTAYYSRFAALADGAAGALLCYGGAPAAACYHSISNGVTEASQNVWTSALPYLQGVASPWDKTADGYETTITYSCEQVDAILQGLGLEPETLADTAPAAWFGAAQLDEAGYVASMSVCGEAFSGTRLRRALALRSTCFTVQYADGTFTFTTRGYGHCVGLSQHGAQSMAEGGADWREILTYYFPGCEVVE